MWEADESGLAKTSCPNCVAKSRRYLDTQVGQFCQISLLKVKGKNIFSVVSHRLTVYLEKNNYIDTSVGFPGFSGCLKHTNMI